MRYLAVSTTNYLLVVDLLSRSCVPIEGSRGEYYGISWFPEASDLVLSHSGLDNGDLVDLSSYVQSETGWISFGSVSTSPFLSQPHQILCAPDGRVVCTNTGRNALTVIDPGKPGLFQEARISSSRWDRLSLTDIPGDHLNSVFIQGSRLYAVAHRYSRGSLLAVFSYPDLQLIETQALGRTGAHNIWITEDGRKISCHSEAGALVDLDSNSALWEAGDEIYTRGLAACADYVVVGESQKTGRDLRRSSLSGLWVLDRRNWTALDHICLGPYGAVNGVRILDEPDEAHHSAPYSGLASLLERNMHADISRRKLASAKAAASDREIWRGFDQILGLPVRSADGMRRAADQNLCLAIQGAPERAIAFDYDMRNHVSGDCHVSAVVGYRGSGGDTDMLALLLHPAGDRGALSVWRNDGAAWSQLPSLGATGMRRCGRIEVTASGQQVTLIVDGSEILNLSAADVGLPDFAGRLGIRWIGSAVKPSTPGSI